MLANDFILELLYAESLLAMVEKLLLETIAALKGSGLTNHIHSQVVSILAINLTRTFVKAGFFIGHCNK